VSKLIAAALAVAVVTGCGRVQEEAGARDGVRSIVATTGIVADAARNVAGDRVTVTALMGPGVDPHLYRASEGDVRRLGEADLVLYNGLHLEAKLADVLGELGQRAVAVAEAIPEDELLSPPEFEGQYDPHVWFDVRL